MNQLNPNISIVRIGGPAGNEVAVEIIQQQLVYHFHHKTGTTRTSSRNNKNSNTRTCSSSDDLILHFENKYFEATVQLKSTTCTATKITQEKNSSIKHKNDKEDGVILIFPHDASIDSFSRVHNQTESNIHDLGDTLRLCLSTSSGRSGITSIKQQEELYSQRVLWCLDHGYEYVEVDLSQEGLTKGFDDREKDGFARVVEAMRGTVWSSAVMKTRSQSVVNKNVNSTESSTSSFKSNIETKNPQDIANNGTENKINVLNQHDIDENKDMRNIESLQPTKNECDSLKKTNDVENNDNKHTSVNDSGDNSDSKEERFGTKNRKKEVVLDNIDKVMKESTRIRQASKYGQLSDDDRRKRAGDAANMLMCLLDQIGFDDDTHDSDGHDNEDAII